MKLQELYDLIELQPEMIQKLDAASAEIDIASIHVYLERLMDIKTAAQAYKALEKLLGEDEDHIKMLYCQLTCACRIFEKYQEKYIPESVFSDTMKCFPRFHEECRKKNGRMFFDRGWWTYRQISMNLFRIGELEYQFEEYEGEHAIAIHIPSDADLSKDAVDNSLKQADVFFRTYYGSYEYSKYICESWLLSPAITPFLGEASNILAFQKRFLITRENKEDREYMEWLFQAPRDADLKSLPAATNLQRKVIELLQNGGAVGSACGFFERREAGMML